MLKYKMTFETEFAGQLASILLLLAAILMILLGNMIILRRVRDYPPLAKWPRLSVLVPARNEERNIEDCVRSLIEQDYPDFEVLVLDDQSTDQTGEILSRLGQTTPRLRVLHGEPLPPGWMGKHWACDQLSRAAQGDLLLLTDADTHYQPGALRHLVAAQAREQADLLAVVPRERVVTPGEKLFVPFFLWAVLSFLPVSLAYRMQAPFLSFAVGQCMLFTRAAYRQSGGHAAVRDEVADDVALARRVKAAGLRWRLADGVEAVSCRMYTNWDEAVAGFSKNAFGAFDYNVTVFLLAWFGLMVPFLEPAVVLMLPGYGVSIPEQALWLAAAGVLLGLLEWLLFVLWLRFPVWLAFIYPLIILLYAALAFRSLFMTLAGRTEWKERRLERRRVRII